MFGKLQDALGVAVGVRSILRGVVGDDRGTLRARLGELEGVAEHIPPDVLLDRALHLLEEATGSGPLGTVRARLSLLSDSEDAARKAVQGPVPWPEVGDNEEIAVVAGSREPVVRRLPEPETGHIEPPEPVSEPMTRAEVGPRNASERVRLREERRRETEQRGEKLCVPCQKRRPLSEFKTDGRTQDGYRNECLRHGAIGTLVEAARGAVQDACEREGAAKTERVEPKSSVCSQGRMCLDYPKLGRPGDRAKGSRNGLCETCRMAREDGYSEEERRIAEEREKRQNGGRSRCAKGSRCVEARGTGLFGDAALLPVGETGVCSGCKSAAGL